MSDWTTLLLDMADAPETSDETFFTTAGAKTETHQLLPDHHDPETGHKTGRELMSAFSDMIKHDDKFFHDVNAEILTFYNAWNQVMEQRAYYKRENISPPMGAVKVLLIYFELIPKRLRPFPILPFLQTRHPYEEVTDWPYRTTILSTDRGAPTITFQKAESPAVGDKGDAPTSEGGST